jgi:hypothetical protein
MLPQRLMIGAVGGAVDGGAVAEALRAMMGRRPFLWFAWGW